MGDLVAFKYPKDPSVTYIKRVAAVSGDKVRIINDTIVLNGVQQERKLAPEADSELLDIGDQRSIKIAFKETLGGVTHLALQNTPETRRFSLANWPESGEDFVVPEGTFFVMGDNRDNAVDSRIYGAIPVELLLAKVEGVVFSIGGPNGIRWDRIGRDLH